jgi:hypothetical protein
MKSLDQWSQIRITLMRSRIRIRIRIIVMSQIRIRIKAERGVRMRIRIKAMMRIRNPAFRLKSESKPNECWFKTSIKEQPVLVPTVRKWWTGRCWRISELSTPSRGPPPAGHAKKKYQRRDLLLTYRTLLYSVLYVGLLLALLLFKYNGEKCGNWSAKICVSVSEI